MKTPLFPGKKVPGEKVKPLEGKHRNPMSAQKTLTTLQTKHKKKYAEQKKTEREIREGP